MIKQKTLTHSERAILRRIDKATKDEPVSLKELKTLANRTERMLKHDIENLRRMGVCIVAIRAKDVGQRAGYFIPRTETERQEGLAPFIRQIKSETEIKNIMLGADLNAHKRLLEVQHEHS